MLKRTLLVPLLTAAAIAEPPPTRVEVVAEKLNGVTVNDPYRWLEDQNAPATRKWVEEQMSYTKSVVEKAPARAKIAARLKELIDIETMGAPIARGGRYFFSKRTPGQKQPVWYWREGLKGQDKILLDANQLSADGMQSYAFLGVTQDGKTMTYGIRQGGEDETTVAFRDVATGADVGDKFPKGRYGGISLTKDLKAFYYAQFTPAGPRVYYHQMGTPKSADKMLFGEAYGPQNIISAGVTRDQKYLLITVFFGAGSEKNEIWYQDLTAKGPIQPLVKGEEARFSANYADNGVLFIETTWRAPRGRVVRVDLSKPGAPDTWKEIVPEGKFPLRSVALAGGHLITSTLENVVPKVRLLTPDGKLVREINPPKLGTVSGPGGNWESDEAFYSFTTYGQPGTIYRYSIRTGSQEVWFRSPAPVDPSQFEVRQVWYASKDGTKIPMFVAHKKGLRLDGTNPVYLTGYGGFNVSQVPGYGAPSTVFMEMGGIWAVPNLRGGSEFGEQWHRAGMLERKQNVFDDFIAAAEYLIANKYTNKEKLAIAGGSNGGLLVGAVMTQRPDLYKAVVCSVPLLDMVRYHRFLVARFWIPEYGSAENAEQFPFIYKYSPYHHVEKGVNYPAVMFVSGDSDTRVDPLHARKMAALMQASGTKNPVLLHYDTKSGHSGGLPVDKQIENTLDTLSFVTMQLGMQ